MKTQFLTGLGILIGIIVASLIKNGRMDWLSIIEAIFAIAAFLYLVTLFFSKREKLLKQNIN